MVDGADAVNRPVQELCAEQSTGTMIKGQTTREGSENTEENANFEFGTAETDEEPDGYDWENQDEYETEDDEETTTSEGHTLIQSGAIFTATE